MKFFFKTFHIEQATSFGKHILQYSGLEFSIFGKPNFEFSDLYPATIYVFWELKDIKIIIIIIRFLLRVYNSQCAYNCI